MTDRIKEIMRAAEVHCMHDFSVRESQIAAHMAVRIAELEEEILMTRDILRKLNDGLTNLAGKPIK